MTGSSKGSSESPTDFNDCVSKAELTKLADEQRQLITDRFDEMMRQISTLVTRVEHLKQRPPPPPPDDNDADRDIARLRFNRRGMGVDGNNDPFAKAKFTMLPFAGSADPEAYLDW